ncbi:MAG TPA: hypothetical protein VIY73_11470, partial [Polyangiaceae bacterium]
MHCRWDGDSPEGFENGVALGPGREAEGALQTRDGGWGRDAGEYAAQGREHRRPVHLVTAVEFPEESVARGGSA